MCESNPRSGAVKTNECFSSSEITYHNKKTVILCADIIATLTPAQTHTKQSDYLDS